MKAPRTHHSRTSLTLMELILAILFFAIASAVCIQLFAKAHVISRDTALRENAVSAVQSVSECIAADPAHIGTQLATGNPAVNTDQAGFHLYYDANWQPSTQNAGVYRMDVRETPADDLTRVTLEVKKLEDDSTLYTLDTDYHIPKTL
ncbi:MAG: hypothetical protein PHI94_00320 [Eubacteriaceae bacterium]|jgi:hypothetical protein|nr:hypothetical protein [Eubacteriaceae bacterium]MDD4507323.1 hypothetical protein [Eubacteriaceae bacterium]